MKEVMEIMTGGRAANDVLEVEEARCVQDIGTAVISSMGRRNLKRSSLAREKMPERLMVHSATNPGFEQLHLTLHLRAANEGNGFTDVLSVCSSNEGENHCRP